VWNLEDIGMFDRKVGLLSFIRYRRYTFVDAVRICPLSVATVLCLPPVGTVGSVRILLTPCSYEVKANAE
jgi:hypothetical protein